MPNFTFNPQDPTTWPPPINTREKMLRLFELLPEILDRAMGDSLSAENEFAVTHEDHDAFTQDQHRIAECQGLVTTVLSSYPLGEGQTPELDRELLHSGDDHCPVCAGSCGAWPGDPVEGQSSTSQKGADE